MPRPKVNHRYKAHSKRSPAKSKARAKHLAKKRTTPRFAIRTGPSSAPNVHMFKRSYDYPLSIGVADVANNVALNTDSTWMVIKLHTKFNKLPAYLEFKDLFSEYKINSIQHTFTPYYKNNVAQSVSDVNATPPTYGVAIPNYEIFAVPTTSSASQQNFGASTGPQINDFLMQSQRKSRRLMPGGTLKYLCTKPMVSDWRGPLNKDGGPAYQAMARAGYCVTTNVPLVAGGVDQTDITHYSITLLVRRVDGLRLQSHGAGSTEVAHMGFRVSVDCFLKLRKVQ